MLSVQNVNELYSTENLQSTVHSTILRGIIKYLVGRAYSYISTYTHKPHTHTHTYTHTHTHIYIYRLYIYIYTYTHMHARTRANLNEIGRLV